MILSRFLNTFLKGLFTQNTLALTQFPLLKIKK